MTKCHVVVCRSGRRAEADPFGISAGIAENEQEDMMIMQRCYWISCVMGPGAS